MAGREPDEVANVALFSASDLSSYMTGTVLEVAGVGTSDGRLIRDTVICEPVRPRSAVTAECSVAYGGRPRRRGASRACSSARGFDLDETVEDYILGHCYPEHGGACDRTCRCIGRGSTGDRARHAAGPRCGSGLQAVIQACMQVGTGQNDLVLAGGAESMSNVVFHSTDMRWGGARGGVKVHDGLNRGRTTAGGRDYPVPGGMTKPPKT